MYSEPHEKLHERQPCSADPTIAQFFASLTPRQVKVAADHLDGFTQAEIAERHGVDQATVSRDLDAVRQTCQRYGKQLPEPMRVHAHAETQLSDELYAQL